MRRSRLWCAAILVSAAVAGPAAPAQAATPGVNIAGPPDAALVQKVIDSGAKSVRIFTAWNGFEPGGPGDYPTTANSDYSLHLRQQVFDDGLQQLNAHGIKPLYVLIDTPAWANGGAGVLTPPTNPQSFANWAGEFAAHNRARGGQVLGYEIWNEADGPDFWHPGPDLGQYVALLKAAHKAIKAGDPAAVVVTAPLVGNNADWLRQLYGAGAGDSFEAVAVHTDTACLVNAPDVFYREDNGDLARFSFLGYRTVRQVMVENGDAGKPIFMSELGW